MRPLLLSIGLLLALQLPAPAAAHTTLTYPPPRTLANTTGPCGTVGSERGTTSTVFEPGETLTVTWDETLDHPGHFRIAFDDFGDDGFPNPVAPEDDFPSVLVDQIADRSGGGLYSQEVTLPDLECESCTLQLVQIATTRVPYDDFYFQCADLALRSGGTSPDGGPDVGSDPGCAVGGTPRLAAVYLLAVLFGCMRLRRRARCRNKKRRIGHSSNASLLATRSFR